MATLLDTSALVVLIRRSAEPGRTRVAEAAAAELRAGRGLVSAVTLAELLVGARDPKAAGSIRELLAQVPAVPVTREIGEQAGTMGSETRAAGSTIPLPDLLIAATAVWLDIPLLTCDGDFERGARLGRGARPRGGWRDFKLHPASDLG